MSLRWRPFLALTRAALIGYARNPLTAFGLFAGLVFFMVALRFVSFGGSQQPTSVALVAGSRTGVAIALEHALETTPGFHVSLATPPQAAADLASDRVTLVVQVPPELGAVDAHGRLLPATVGVSYKDSPAAAQGAQVITALVDQVDRAAQGAPQVITVSPRIEGQSQELVSIFLPGMLAFNVVNAGLLVAAGIFAGYRSTGVLRRIQATGVSPATLVVAHATANLIVATVQVLAMIVAAMFIFGTRLDAPPLAGVTLLGYLVFLAIGFVISGWIRDAQRAPAVAGMVAMPLIFVGFFPAGSFPGVVGQVVDLLPISFVTHALRQLIEGGGWAAIRLDLTGLVAWAAAMLAIAGRAFRWDPA